MNYKEEYIKCLKDKTRKYFIENYLSTFNADERKEVPFRLFPRQIAFLHSLVDNPNTVAIKHRQAGITTVSSAWITGQLVFASAKSPETVLCIGNKLDISQQLVDKIGAFLDQVPRWMWGSDYWSPDPKSEKNTKSIYKARNKQYIELFNGCKVHARSSGENAARGISAVSILIFDEAAFIQNGTTVYAQAVAATASVANAKIIMVSTPNGKDALYYKTYVNAIDKKNNYHAVEFKWFQDLRYQRNLRWERKNKDTGENEVVYETVIGQKGQIKYDEERWRKLEREGWTPISPWYIEMCKTFNNDSQKIAQELNVSFLGSSDNVVPVDVIEKQLKENVVEITDDWKLRDMLHNETWIWKDPIPEHRYICACLPKGEQVLTDCGYKNIEKISLNDKLYSLDGKTINIVKKFERCVEDETVYGFKLYGHITTTTYTGNHPIYSSKSELLRNYSKHNDTYIFNERYWKHNFSYIKASDVNSGDWLQLPNLYVDKTLTNEEILEKWNGNEKYYNPILEEDFWWYCGMWLAEGCCVKRKNNYDIYTSHNINEIDYQFKITDICNKLFSRKCNIHKFNNQEKCVNIKFCHKQLALFLDKNFGKYACGKFIAEWIKFLPKKYKIQLILGYLQGDGSFVNNKREGLTVKANSVSYKLLEDIQDLLFSLGIVSRVTIGHNAKKRFINGREINGKTIYELSTGRYYSQELVKLIGLNQFNDNVPHIYHKGFVYLSKDLKTIYWRISAITSSKYSGIVYNFETETHNYLTNKMVVHNCDGSSGSGEDYTAIQIIDVDGIDDKGMPCFEQVLEYNGKIYGNDAGQLINRYGRIYNDALVVTECIGGYGDAIILSLLDLKYPNLYYDNPQIKNYTNQNKMQKGLSYYEQQNQLPGFRTSSLRLQMISNFVDMLKTNSFRVRSQRVINELDTWIFKSGRPDHMDGAHDDLLTCLAMGLFVMQFYMLSSEKQKAKDKYIVQSWYVNSSANTMTETKKLEDNTSMNNNAYNAKHFNPFMANNRKKQQKQLDACIMLGGFKPSKRL